MKVIHEGVIGSHSFQMVDNTTIEVWSDFDNDQPESYIFVNEGAVNDEKSFHAEISYWYMKNVG